jgi:two-component system, OmpR family, alkaline phosphatase synthesis response regulator PhoP
MVDFKKILIVDDSITILEVVKKFMKNATFEIMTANNGLSGLKIAQVEKPDVVLLDIMLPKMDGYNVCKNIKADSALSHTKVIMFSVKSDKQSRETARTVGADCFLMKETEMEKISETIDSLLESK